MKSDLNERSKGSKKMTVEQCRAVSTTFLKDNGYFRDSCKEGCIRWIRNGEEILSINLFVSLQEWSGEIHFQYFPTQYQNGENKYLDYPVRLTATPCFGDKRKRRWWFLCPRSDYDIICDRRVLKLYLADGKSFACRHCLGLTYTSTQQNDKRVNAIVKNPGLLSTAVRNSSVSGMNLVAIKAAFKLKRKLERRKRQ